MHPERFSTFWMITIAINIILDLYVLYNWQKFVKRRRYSSWLYKSLWITGAVILIASIVSRLTTLETTNPAIGYVVMLISYLWYLPKILIVIALLVKDIARLLIFLVGKTVDFISKKTVNKQNAIISSELPIDTNSSEAVELVPRRDFLQKVAWAAAGTPFIAAANGMFSTAFDFETYSHYLPINGLPRQFEGLRIVQISDIHSGSFGSTKPMQEVRRIIQDLHPDIILITGDYVNFNPKELASTFPDLSKLSAPLGVFGSMGNHDHYMTHDEHEVLKKGIRDAGIQLLINSNTVIHVDGGALNIAAIDNVGLGQKFGRIDEALQGLNASNPTILMAHDPTFWDKHVRGQLPIDVMLSGHTHGGQVGVHIMGEDLSFARMVYKQWAGMYYDRDQILYVNRGIGMVGPPIRLAIEPEITLFTLTSPDNKG